MARANTRDSAENTAFLEEILTKASMDFAKNALDMEAKSLPKPTLKRMWAAEIDILGEAKARARLLAGKKSLKRIASLLTIAPAEDKELEDALGEIANMIVGRAKVIGEESGRDLKISTPRFLGRSRAADLGAGVLVCFSFGGCELTLCAREMA